MNFTGPITVEVLKDFDFYFHGEIMHASQGKHFELLKPDVNTAAAIEQGYVRIVTTEDFIDHLVLPSRLERMECDGDMPSLVQRPNSLDWDAATMVRRAMETHKDNPPDKAITIFLWDEAGKYDTVFFNSGLSIMQGVALLEKIKWDLLKEMDDQHKGAT